MAVRPPHGQLKDVMKICDGGISVDEEATLNQGTDPTQGNLELVNNSIWRVEHERRLSDFLSSHLPRFLADSAQRLPPAGWSCRTVVQSPYGFRAPRCVSQTALR